MATEKEHAHLNDYSQKGALAQIFRVAHTVGQAAFNSVKIRDLFNGKACPSLSGGMKVNIRTVADSPLLTLRLEVNSGAEQDPAHSKGAAHMLEHMMFSQNSEARNDLEREFTRRGGSRAAFTSPDGTLYEFSILDEGDNFEFMCGRMARHIFDMKIDPAQLEAEKAVVLDELRMATDMRNEKLDLLAVNLACGKEAQDHDVLGSRESIAALTVQDLEAFRRRNYAAGNCRLSFSGPAGPLRVTQILEKYFGGIEGGAPPAPERAGPNAPQSVERRIEAMDKEDVSYAVALPLRAGDLKPPVNVQKVFGEYVDQAMFEKTRGDTDRYSYAQTGRLMAVDSVPFLVLEGHVGPDDANRLLQDFSAVLRDMVAGKIDPRLLAQAQGACAFKQAQSGRRYVLQDHMFADPAETARDDRDKIMSLRATEADDMQAMAQLLDYGAATMVVRGPLDGVMDLQALKGILPQREGPAVEISVPPAAERAARMAQTIA